MTLNHRNRPAGRRRSHQGPQQSHSEYVQRGSVELAQRVTDAIVPIVESNALFLEDVKIGRGGQRLVVKVTVDLPEGPGGVDSDLLTDVSREISKRLDDVDLVQGAYTLEVSTPGAERILTQARHFSRAQGRLVTLKLKNGDSLNGRLRSLHGDTVCVSVGNEEKTISMVDIESGRVRIDMNGVDSEGEEA